MKIILLAAGLGSRLKPLTDNCPKSLLHILDNKSVIERTIDMINSCCQCEIVVVTGYKRHKLNDVLLKYSNCTLVNNPFYRVTNSIASLWFAKDHLSDDVIIFNADVIISDKLLKVILETKTKAAVFYDSSIGMEADYKVAEQNGKVIVMSDELKDFSGEYVGVTKLNKESALQLKNKVESMIDDELYCEWYETALVEMIFEKEFLLEAVDVANHEWTEIDNINDLIKAKEIITKLKILKKIKNKD
ncbi:MAG: phosphocholine cytidylyltransferase family protein [Sedimentibacter sp.]|uniref:phosphocholine cytidylyltransferase family protein n=1 Tax=Sedimentibacter sp. TaxID=1960295 RepID=UPI0031584FC1